MVTTRITDAVPMTMPSAVSANRVLLARKLSNASFRISLSTMVSRALVRVSSNVLLRTCCWVIFISSYEYQDAPAHRPAPGNEQRPRAGGPVDRLTASHCRRADGGLDQHPFSYPGPAFGTE